MCTNEKEFLFRLQTWFSQPGKVYFLLIYSKQALLYLEKQGVPMENHLFYR